MAGSDRLPIIAEDLGVITPDVTALREQFGFPGMRVAQFGFDDDPDTALHHPENYPTDVVAYTGTHDNDTTVGWFWGTTQDTIGADSTPTENACFAHSAAPDGEDQLGAGQVCLRARKPTPPSSRCRTCSPSAPRPG